MSDIDNFILACFVFFNSYILMNDCNKTAFSIVVIIVTYTDGSTLVLTRKHLFWWVLPRLQSLRFRWVKTPWIQFMVNQGWIIIKLMLFTSICYYCLISSIFSSIIFYFFIHYTIMSSWMIVIALILMATLLLMEGET